MILLVASSKGGCGKSTLTVNISAILATRQENVALLDCDRIRTATNWLEARANTKCINIAGYTHQGANKLISHIRSLAKKHSYVVIDVPGADSEVMRTCMTIADVILIPFRPSQADMDQLPHMKSMVEDMYEINPDARVYFLLNAARVGTESTEIKGSFEYFGNFSIVPVKTVIYDRKSYRDGLEEGHGVVERKDQKAMNEIKNLSQEVGLW
jgi:chromosome partitioning protein